MGVSGAAPGTATGRGQRGNASKARVFPAPAPPERMETVLQLHALARGASELASGRAVESLAVAAFTGGRIRRERKWQEHQAEAARANQQHFKRELLRAQSARQRSFKSLDEAGGVRRFVEVDPRTGRTIGVPLRVVPLRAVGRDARCTGPQAGAPSSVAIVKRRSKLCCVLQ